MLIFAIEIEIGIDCNWFCSIGCGTIRHVVASSAESANITAGRYTSNFSCPSPMVFDPDPDRDFDLELVP
jgi:hypothetical protein